MVGRSLLAFCLVFLMQQASAKNATLTLLHDEVEKMNALCLDGSAPGYYMRAGTGDSTRKWIVHLMGGGWCNKGVEDCYKRSLTKLGSTKFWPDTYPLQGFLSDDPAVNPDFHDWNIVYVIYCDGSSFGGNIFQPINTNNGANIYFRGYRILQAVITHLNKEREMEKASDIVLTGCSAGGLAVYLHADHVQTMVNNNAKYRAFADAGYFVDITDVNGTTSFVEDMAALIEYQNIVPALSQTCKDRYPAMEKWKCIFAPYIYGDIKTPIFVLNSMYDTAQLSSIYGLPCLPGNCTSEMMKLFEHFHEVFVEKIAPVLSSTSNGYYFDSCLVHCQTLTDTAWRSYQALGHPMRESFADWYYERPSPANATRVKDCDQYPCNHSCP